MTLKSLSPCPQKSTVIKAKPRIEANRVLVTGGAGFVGSHLCTYLVERGDHVSKRREADAAKRERGWGRGLGDNQRGGSGARPGAPPPSSHSFSLFSLLPSPQVICVDNFFTGSKENIAHLLDKVWGKIGERKGDYERASGRPPPPSAQAASNPFFFLNPLPTSSHLPAS